MSSFDVIMVCVCVNRYPEANSVTELWGSFSKPHSVTVQTLESVAYCYVSSLALLAILIPAIATTQVHPPTWASLVSVPEFRLPTPSSLSLPVPVLLRAHLPTNTPPPCSFPRVCKGGPELFFRCLLAPPRLPPSPPTSHPVSLAHTQNKGRSATNCATVSCRCSM